MFAVLLGLRKSETCHHFNSYIASLLAVALAGEDLNELKDSQPGCSMQQHLVFPTTVQSWGRLEAGEASSSKQVVEGGLIFGLRIVNKLISHKIREFTSEEHAACCPR